MVATTGLLDPAGSFACLRMTHAPNIWGMQMSKFSLVTASLGFPRIGPRRELKFALESHWAGKSTEEELLRTARNIRSDNWARQKSAGITRIPSNDFSLYDHVLDTSLMVGAIPKEYGWTAGPAGLDVYFAMARGVSRSCPIPALEMTKWFDTNYHYMVPEFSAGQHFELTTNKPLEAFQEAKELGYHTRPALLGPVTFLKLGKCRQGDVDPLSLLPGLLPVYEAILRQLAAAGADWVQIDEPCLVLDLSFEERKLIAAAYQTLAAAAPGLRIMLATYFGDLGDNLDAALHLPVSGLHIDLTRGALCADRIARLAPFDLVLSLGIVDGRNVWRADLAGILRRIRPLVDERGADKIELATSCSLLHVPVDLDGERRLDKDVASWLSFGAQKLDELSLLAHLINARPAVIESLMEVSNAAAAARLSSPKAHSATVAARLEKTVAGEAKRSSSFEDRRKIQQRRFGLPPFPTTTIGSFPQTSEIRSMRAKRDRGETSEADYNAFLRGETQDVIRWQDEIGLDVLVHGEFERNDMVQYFGERLSGFAFTELGWVQSYGSRCVRPPIIFGDVSRPRPMTVEWAQFAQSLTRRPVKGMLTGPVTMLQWSFVRDDLPRETVCRQIALALGDEVLDLERAGIGIIQIDEPALREGLPLRKAEWNDYLAWAVDCFRIATSKVGDKTQIHTHMCYSEFNDIMSAIASMDADVISIETSRSKMELLDAFSKDGYPNEIGPGVYDIHSPRVPEVGEMVDLLEKAAGKLAPWQLWVNPDCGLKTRKWEEVRPALVNLVEATRIMRAKRRDISPNEPEA